jgi:hypothetical protein
LGRELDTLQRASKRKDRELEDKIYVMEKEREREKTKQKQSLREERERTIEAGKEIGRIEADKEKNKGKKIEGEKNVSKFISPSATLNSKKKSADMSPCSMDDFYISKLEKRQEYISSMGKSQNDSLFTVTAARTSMMKRNESSERSSCSLSPPSRKRRRITNAKKSIVKDNSCSEGSGESLEHEKRTIGKPRGRKPSKRLSEKMEIVKKRKMNDNDEFLEEAKNVKRISSGKLSKSGTPFDLKNSSTDNFEKVDIGKTPKKARLSYPSLKEIGSYVFFVCLILV